MKAGHRKREEVTLCEGRGSAGSLGMGTAGRAETGSSRDRNSEEGSEASRSAVRVRPRASHRKGSRTRARTNGR